VIRMKCINAEDTRTMKKYFCLVSVGGCAYRDAA